MTTPNPTSRLDYPGSHATESISARNYTFLQTYIYRESGIVLDDDKQYLFESRLRPIVVREGIASIDALCDLVASGRSPALATRVIDAMTTNETLFFRDTAIFETMKTTVLPALIAAAGSRRLRIWSAASSTGQEAYSLAITLLEANINPNQVEIVGTDLSELVVDRAASGKYVQFEVGRGMPIALLLKYFTKVGLDWQIKPEVRSMVHFRKLDLRGSFAALGKFDLVLCRNVLIYFDSATKEQIVTSIATTLLPGGMLVLGCAETLISMDHKYERKVFGHSTFYALR